MMRRAVLTRPYLDFALGVLVLHGLYLLPDVVAPHGLLERQRDVRVDVRVRPRDDGVAAKL